MVPSSPTPIAFSHIARDPVAADRYQCDASYYNQRLNGTPDWLLIMTVDGGGWVGTKEASFETAPGDIILYEPHTPQTYGTLPHSGQWHILWAHFYPRPHWMDWLRWPQREKGLMFNPIGDVEVRLKVCDALHECIRLNRQHLKAAHDLAFNALERAVLWSHSASQNSGIDRRVRHALEILAEEINQPLVLSHLAKRCGLSLSRFAHLFRTEIGMPPQRYLENIRMERAALLLRSTSLSIGEIAVASGYANLFYFSNRFKEAFKQRPSAYRSAHAKR